MKKTANIHIFFSLSLLFLFAGCTFLILYGQIRGYEQVRAFDKQMEQEHLPLSYLRQKIRSYDKKGGIQLKERAGVQCLVFLEEGAKTWVYVKDGALRELYALEEYEVDLAAGESLFPCGELKAEVKGNLLKLSVDGKSFSMRLRSEGALS